jgi:GPH family glycoside/pentoside/hexuronide:cation symporter
VTALRASSLRQSARYAVGGAPEGLKSAVFDLFVLFYYNQLLGLPGTWAGLALAFSLIVEASVNPLIGAWSDGLRSKWGRRHPFMIFAAVPFGLSFFLLLSPPALGDMMLAIWLGLFAMLSRTLLTVFQVPYLALGAELANDSVGRTRFFAARQVVEGAGMFAGSYLAFNFFFTDANGGRGNVELYSPFAATIGVLAASFMIASAYLTRKSIPDLAQPAPTQRLGFKSTVRNLKRALANRSFLALMAFSLVTWIAIGSANAFNLYIYEFFWRLDTSKLLWLNSAWPVGILIGATLTTYFHRHFEKRAVLFVGAAGWALGQLIPVSLRLSGLIEADGSAAVGYGLIAVKFLQGVLIAQALVSIGSMIGDIADEQALRHGERQEGVFFGFFQFFKRFNGGLGGLVAGAGLDFVGWSGAAAKGGADAPADAVAGLGYFYGPFAAAMVLIGLCCLAFYRISASRHRDIVAELEARHRSDGEAS